MSDVVKALLSDHAHLRDCRLSVMTFGAASFYIREPSSISAPNQVSCIPKGIYKVVRDKNTEPYNEWVITGVRDRADVRIIDNPYIPMREDSLLIGDNYECTKGTIQLLYRRRALHRLNDFLVGVNWFTLYIQRAIGRIPELTYYQNPDTTQLSYDDVDDV